MLIDIPLAEIERLVADAEHRGGRWTVLETHADLALWRDLAAFGFRVPSQRAMAKRWSLPRSTAQRLIVGVGLSGSGGTPHIGGSVGHPPGHPGTATLETVQPRHLVTTVRDKVRMLRGLVKKVRVVRGLDPEDCVQEVYRRCLEKQRTRGSFWQPHKASLEAWVYLVARSTLLHLVDKQADPMTVADADGLGRAAERRPMAWGVVPAEVQQRRVRREEDE
jgi:hypothetical protein